MATEPWARRVAVLPELFEELAQGRLITRGGTRVVVTGDAGAGPGKYSWWPSSSRTILFRKWWPDVADYSRLPGPGQDHWYWQEHAACRGLRTMMFFHPQGERGPTRTHREAEAKAVCQRCPVIEACRRHALQAQEPYGVWGGLSAEERADQLRAHRRARSIPRGARSNNRYDVDAN